MEHEWEYWRDSGQVNVWQADGYEWLLQVGHTFGWVGVDCVGVGDASAVAVHEPSDIEASKLVLHAMLDPEAVYDGLREIPESLQYNIS